MRKIVLLGVIYWEVEIGGVTHMSFNPQELVIKMASMGLSLN
jgi:hypothetical protein